MRFHAVLDAEGDRLNTLATVALLGMALQYTAIGVANTLLMATSGRARDVAVLRLSGATPGQVLRMIGAEAVLVTALGAVLAVVAVVPAVAGLVLALRGGNPEVLVVDPWGPVTRDHRRLPRHRAGRQPAPGGRTGAPATRRPGEHLGVATKIMDP